MDGVFTHLSDASLCTTRMPVQTFSAPNVGQARQMQGLHRCFSQVKLRSTNYGLVAQTWAVFDHILVTSGQMRLVSF